MKKGWFGPKQIGWGVSPKTWEGWAVTVLLIATFAAAVRWLAPMLATNTGLPQVVVTTVLAVIWLAVTLAVVWVTYDRKS